MIQKFPPFRSSAYRFRDKHFFRKNGQIGNFSRSHDQKWNFSVRYFFFLWWSPNFVRFALALTVSEISTFFAKLPNRYFFKVTWPSKANHIAVMVYCLHDYMSIYYIPCGSSISWRPLTSLPPLPLLFSTKSIYATRWECVIELNWINICISNDHPIITF